MSSSSGGDEVEEDVAVDTSAEDDDACSASRSSIFSCSGDKVPIPLELMLLKEPPDSVMFCVI